MANRLKAEEGTESPRAVYQQRRERWRQQRAREEGLHRRLGPINIGLGAATAAVIFLGIGGWLNSVLWAALPLASLIALAIVHEGVLKRRGHCERLTAYYERALARLEGDWQTAGDDGIRFLDDAHLYARDLDLFGKGSLYQLLCTARTQGGRDRLAHWLCATAPPEEALKRQAAVTELRARWLLREELAELADAARSLAPAGALPAWAEGHASIPVPRLRWISPALAMLWLASLAGWAIWDLRFLAITISALNLYVHSRFSTRVHKAAEAAEAVASELALLSDVLARLEGEKFESSQLDELMQSLRTEKEAPSAALAGLRRRMGYLESRRNMIVGVLDPFVLWTLQCVCAVEKWRSRNGGMVRRWLEAVAEMEALLSLANYSYEHPDDVFPEFAGERPLLELREFAHPLLPEGMAVRNDLALGAGRQLAIVSGPNMAGKSTLIRAAGLNVVLAQCGGTVRARGMRLSPLAVGASIVVLDSLQGGVSRFYAEIRRLKQIVDLTRGRVGVLFLLDEFLQGTNSNDRREGAEATLRTLVEGGAIGLVSTHDLALTGIADRMGGRAFNAHIADRLEEGKLVFTYRLEPGVAQTSNALALMRSIGLEV